MADPLSPFLPPVQEWFRDTLGRPTPPQVEGWPAIRRGEHTLILAPTGSGKTLAAFLCGIDQLYRDLVEPQPAGVRLLYVSPLKALNNDVERNLRVPLEGIHAAAARAKSPLPEVRVAVRTGDTSAAARRQMLRKPPHILITTPESLYLMLTSPLARDIFRTVRTVIVDEIHTLCGEKRGVHLSLSLERLVHLAAPPVQRIGLSATIRPLDEVARFLGGQERAATGSRPSPFGVADHAPAQYRRGGLSPQGRIPTGRAEGSPSGTYGRGPDSPPSAALGHKGIAARTAVQDSGVVLPGSTLTARAVTIVDAGYRKPLDLRVITAVDDFSAMPGGTVWPSLVPRVLHDIMTHRSTLIFANSRRIAERTADRLNVQLEAEQSEEIEPGSTEGLAPGGVPRDGGMFTVGANGPIRAHHGSMSKEARRAIEEDLKEGRLPALVGTSSLELGIDIGAIDLVVQVQSPKSVAQGLQRVGRSGHLVGQTSVGHIYTLFREDLLEAAAVARGMLEGDVELMYTPQNPLDVLAQQIVAMVAVEDWSAAELHQLVRGAYAYHDLSRGSFDLVLEMLAGKYRDVGSHLRARIGWDRINDRLSALPGSRLLALSNGGTITDRGAYGVYLGDGKTKIGELDEEFVFETKVGNTFLLGSQAWRVLDIQNDRILVADAAGSMVRMPFWRGDFPWRTYELGLRIGRFRREIADRIRAAGSPPQAARAAIHNPKGVVPAGDNDEALADWLRKDFCLDDRSVRNLVAYVRSQLSSSGVISSDRQIVFESCEDALGARLWVIHSPFGGRINGAWALVIGSALREQAGIDIETQTNDDGILFRFPQREQEPSAGLLRMSPQEARERILRALPDSAVFGAHFRMNASRALLLPGARGGKRTPFWLQRLKAKDLLAVVRKFDDFPIVAETYRECLRDVLDLPHLEEVLSNIQSGHIELVPIETYTPSPIAAALLKQFETIYQYEWDTPKAERAIQALTLRQGVLEELLGEGGAGLSELLKPQAIAELVRQAQHLEPGFRARSSEELAQQLFELGDLTTEEIEQRSAHSAEANGPELVSGNSPAAGWLADLAANGRVVEMQLPAQNGPERRWVHAELASQYREAFSNHEAAALAVLRRFLRNSGPVTFGSLRARYAFEPRWLEGALARIVEAHELARGRFTAGLGTDEYCDRENLERIHRRTLTILRNEVQPVSPATFTEFMLRWQRAHPSVRLAGAEGLQQVMEQLRGVLLPGVVWERDVLPLRLQPYLAPELDRLALSGRLSWVAEGKDLRRARVRFLLRGEGGVFLAPPHEPPADLSEPARAVHDYLKSEGASFAADIDAGTHLGTRALHDALVELVLAGRVTNDTMNTLRALLEYDGGSARGVPNPLETELAARMQQPARITSVRYRAAKVRVRAKLRQDPVDQRWDGRWSLVRRAAVLGAWENREDRAARLAQLLLDRYGVVTRDCLQFEELPIEWAELYHQLERKEMRGEVRRGYFVKGLAGAQFALPDALEKLRAAGWRPSPFGVAEGGLSPQGPKGIAARKVPARMPASLDAGALGAGTAVRNTGGAAPVAGSHDDALIVISASDPANMLSLEFSLEPSDSPSPLRFTRTPSTHVVVQRGQPVLVAEDHGSRIRTAPGASPEVVTRALQAYLARPHTQRRVSVSAWNGADVLGSAGEALLHDAGFSRAPNGMEKWGA